jgi:serine/threonine protein kinase
VHAPHQALATPAPLPAQLLRNANGRRFKEAKILDLFGQIAQGMYHVHSLNILHRDLKTANILLTREGVIKLADFGIARVMSSDTDMAETRIGASRILSSKTEPSLQGDHPSQIPCKCTQSRGCRVQGAGWMVEGVSCRV